MVWLKYYEKERESYPLHWKERYEIDDATKIIKKLLRHFKIDAGFEFVNHRCGRAWANKGGIWIRRKRKERYFRNGFMSFPKKGILLSMICHEIGHIRHTMRYNEQGHNRHLWSVSRPIFGYAKRFIRQKIEIETFEGNDIY
jgi:hypothetical protein